MHAIVHFSVDEPYDSKWLGRSGDTPVDLLSFDKSRDFDFQAEHTFMKIRCAYWVANGAFGFSALLYLLI